MRRMALVITVLAPLLLARASLAQYSVEKDSWSFRNFKTKPMPWDVYRDTFIGIPPTEDAVASPFDALFYEQLYKEKLSKSGNCYGLSLQSLMMLKNGGHLGFCVPVNQYSGDLVGDGTGSGFMGPTEPMLKRAINIMHGHQVNMPTVQLISDIFFQHKNRNASFAYTSFQNAQLQKDFTLVSMTKSLDPNDGGHTIVAYDAQDLGGGNKRIYVYDNNRSYADPAGRSWYTSGQNYIQINGNAWSFDKGSEIWSGDPGSGGSLIIIPISVTGPHTRSPASLGDQIIGRILNELLLTGSSAQIEQVTDDRGKRLFVPGTNEIDTSAAGMMSMIPWYPSDQTAASASVEPSLVLFHIGRAGSTLNVSVRAGESDYTLIASGPRGRVTVQSSGGRGTDVITLNQAGTQQPRVVVRNGRGLAAYSVEFLHSVQPRQSLRALKATGIAIPEGASVELGVNDRGQALSVNSPEAAIRYDLELQNLTRKGIESLSRKGVAHPAGLSQTVRPRDWSHLQAADVLEQALPSQVPLPVRPATRAAEQSGRRAN